MATSSIYRHRWILTSGGYVVYRHLIPDIFDQPGRADEAALAHRVATFVTEQEAADYCEYRNRLMDERGSDALN